MSDELVTRILGAAGALPERVALRCHDGQLTYAQLIAWAWGIREQLVEQGVVKGDRVGLLTGDDLATYSSLLAIWLTGAAYVPLNRDNPARRLGEILEEADLSVVVASQPTDALLEVSGMQRALLVAPRRSPSVEVERPADWIPPKPEELAYLMFTSGSTGRPKGVPIRHRHLSFFVDAWRQMVPVQVSEEDRFLQMFQLSFDLSVVGVWIPWSLGASAHVVPESGIGFLNVYRVLRQQEITISLMVPSVLSYLDRYFDEMRLPGLRYSSFCGEALLEELVGRWAACVPNALIQNTYGPTESTVLCFCYDWDADSSAAHAIDGIVPIGRPLPGTGGVVLDEAGSFLPVGEIGELCLYGPLVTDGYWCNAERTEQAFFRAEVDGEEQWLYRTGDLAQVDENGLTCWRGRKDFQVKIDGHRIELGEIEAHVRDITGSSQVAAVVCDGPDGRPAIVVFVGGEGTGPEVIQERLTSLLPQYMQPRTVKILSQLPLNQNGKIDRPRLKRDYA